MKKIKLRYKDTAIKRPKVIPAKKGKRTPYKREKINKNNFNSID